MKLNQKKSFYTFSGSWFDIFDKLIGVLQPRNTTQFTIWESKRNKNGHLLIAYGTALPPDLQNRHDLKEITEPEFQASYIPSLRDHIVHGYNEFQARSFKLKFFGFSDN